MSLCIAAGAKVITLAAAAFSLSWTHSVEKTLWEEEWIIEQHALRLIQSSVQGSGAGIDLPQNARLTGSKWIYEPALRPVEQLILAASGTTASAWTLCTADTCLQLGAEASEPITLWAADQCSPGSED